MNRELFGIILNSLFGGVLLILLGSSIKFNKSDNIVNCNQEKYDKGRAYRIFGRNFLITGIIIILLPLFCIFIKEEHYTYVAMVQAITGSLSFAITIIQFVLKCRR